MNKTGKILLILLALVVFSGFGLMVRADIGEPGSEDDPLVTKSYVDRVVSELKGYFDKGVPVTGPAQDLEVVYLEKGDRLIAGKGTEIILRSGTALIVDSENGGIADVTGGKDLRKGEKVPQNHLLIVPREDGRGVVAQTSLVLLVRGSFEVTK
ncbi:hypothetical protein [Thermosediminibacter litoriperuensis]|uniref:Uncharacterized protein n=1 Tax=Thermosediminibacter litoriperuensis TaxID=291989 RepID=A0A5S5AWU1_9FIRM|nr:hypothetical protein [Thermosediminibacter litoriperuensis]TYP57821.1 hypothetical protein LZ11_00479 [Thermosediminibacter litoriperuensis]